MNPTDFRNNASEPLLFLKVHCSKHNLISVLDIGAFERLLGPCVEIMQRNVSNYESQLTELFGEQLSIDDLRR